MSDADLRSERRFASQFNDGKDSPVQVRSTDEKRIGGYAAMFDRMSQNLGGFKERIAPGAFNYSRSQGWPNVLARYNHDDDRLLGTSGSGHLRMDVDQVGLRYEVDINSEDRSALDVFARVARGDVRQSSFAFIADQDEWDTDDSGFPRRSLLSTRLIDVAPVNSPAYLDTTVGQRSLAEEMRSVGGALIGAGAAFASLAKKFDATPEEVRKLAASNQLSKFFTRTDNVGPEATKRSAQAALAKAMSFK
jgi:HK97 family phage prohead protease